MGAIEATFLGSNDLKIGQNVCLDETPMSLSLGDLGPKITHCRSNSFCTEIDTGEQSRVIMALLFFFLSY